MPHHRHSVPAQDEPLNIGEVKRGLAVGVMRIGLLIIASKQPAEKSTALFCRRRVSVVGLGHGIIPVPHSFAAGLDACYPAAEDGDLLSAIRA
jgi:hypothetical protein